MNSKTTATTQPFYLNDQAQPEASGIVALLFFFLGTPHIYSHLRKRSNQEMPHLRPLISFVTKKLGIVLAIVGLARLVMVLT